MFKEHFSFIAPANPDVRIWRYLDFTKYVALLHSRALFFCRSDLLGDPFEGSWPRGNISTRAEILVTADRRDQLPEDEIERRRVSYDQGMKRVNEAMRRWTAVSCWHMGEDESAAMWGLYVPNGLGVAIQSTYRRLVAAFEDCEEDVYIGTVRYLDFDRDQLPCPNTTEAITCKRKSFFHEAELRAAIIRMQTVVDADDRRFDYGKAAWEFGQDVTINLESLVSAVSISPLAPPWFAGLVGAISDTYGLRVPINQSNLLGDPLY